MLAPWVLSADRRAWRLLFLALEERGGVAQSRRAWYDVCDNLGLETILRTKSKNRAVDNHIGLNMRLLFYLEIKFEKWGQDTTALYSR